MSYKSVPQELPTRVSHKSVLQEYPTRVSYKSVPQECPATVSHKSVLQERPTRASYKSVPQEFPTRVSHKSVPQECPVRVSHKSFLQECPTRVSYKSVIWTYVAFRTCLHSGSWAPSCFFQRERDVLIKGFEKKRCEKTTSSKHSSCFIFHHVGPLQAGQRHLAWQFQRAPCSRLAEMDAIWIVYFRSRYVTGSCLVCQYQPMIRTDRAYRSKQHIFFRFMVMPLLLVASSYY